VFVTGGADIGKTVLVERFLHQPPRVPWMVRGDLIQAHGLREAYLGVLAALVRLVRSAGDEEVLAGLRRLAPTWLAQMPWLAGDDAERCRRWARGSGCLAADGDRGFR
jgi:hypothetical protein